MTATWLFARVLLLWLFAIAVMDLRSRKVRNWMVLLGLAIGTVALFTNAQPFWVEPWNGLIGMLVAFAALLPFYALRWMGAGDVKFAAVAGLWFGFSPWLLVIWLGGSLLAGLHGLIVLAWRGFKRGSHGAMLQARVPVRWAHVLAAPATAPAAAAGGQRVISRSIPYAGYMAIVAIWVVLRAGPQWATTT